VRGRAARTLLPALAVLALVGIVAIAATGSSATGTGDTRAPDSLFDAIVSLGMLGVVVGGIFFLYGLTQRSAVAREAARMRRRGLAFSLFTTFMALLVIGAYFQFRNWERRDPVVEVGEPAFPGAPQSPDAPPTNPDASPYEPRFAWIPVAVVIALGLLAVAAYVLSERRRNLAVEEEDLAEQIAAVLDDTLDDLRAEEDPRRAVIATYARLERVLAAYGVPRRQDETATEYLARVLGSLSVDERAARRLTDLFGEAKFSQHMVDAVMKEEAIDALVGVRDDLRRSAEAHAQAAALPAAGQPA
jgi:cbb3-type cytochrome oxidase subunit 3